MRRVGSQQSYFQFVDALFYLGAIQLEVDVVALYQGLAEFRWVFVPLGIIAGVGPGIGGSAAAGPGNEALVEFDFEFVAGAKPREVQTQGAGAQGVP